jgi:hypothetical protein
MAAKRAKVFESLLQDLRRIGAEQVASECEKLGPDGTVNRLRGGVNSLCRGLASAEQVAEMLRAFRDTRP